MATHLHHYRLTLAWRGNRGQGMQNASDYGREYDITGSDGKTLAGSADAQFAGDASRWNPEELLLVSLSACHQLWYLQVCAAVGIQVLHYADAPHGVMDIRRGQFVAVTLMPEVIVAAESDMAQALHQLAHKKCYIARSVNFPVRVALGSS